MNTFKINTMAEMAQKKDIPDILFWVGCAGSFDSRAQKVIISLAKILNAAEIKFAVLGQEEKCTGDPARRLGNEFLFQLTALQNINTLNKYKIKKIVTTCPHCFNTLKNEYKDLGGHYEVLHHTELIKSLIDESKIKINTIFEEKNIVYHDSCYLGRANKIYEAPREILKELKANVKEMNRYKQTSLCCGAGGGQMFKEPEKGKKDINIERTEEALKSNPDIVAVACPFCMIMIRDGITHFNRDEKVKTMDIAELTLKALEKTDDNK